MFDISKELVLCDGMVMRRKDAIEYMKGRLSHSCPGSHSSWFIKSVSVVSEEGEGGLSPLLTVPPNLSFKFNQISISLAAFIPVSRNS